MKKIFLLISLLITLPACSQFALVTSSSSFVASNNIYAKVYSGADLITNITTKKDIKTHAYNHLVKPAVVTYKKVENHIPIKTYTSKAMFGWEYIPNDLGKRR
jgi:hypothetical protein